MLSRNYLHQLQNKPEMTVYIWIDPKMISKEQWSVISCALILIMTKYNQKFLEIKQPESSMWNVLSEVCILVSESGLWLWLWGFKATFNNIPVISWWSVLLVEETRKPASHWQTLSHNVVSTTPRHKRDSNSQHYWW